MRPVLIALLAVAATVLLAAPASGQTVTCSPGEYGLADGDDPRVTDLVTHNLPRRTDGYAPRCLVADALAADIQLAIHHGEGKPRTLHVYGARWSAGKWRCRYPGDEARCKNVKKPKRRITMRLV